MCVSWFGYLIARSGDNEGGIMGGQSIQRLARGNLICNGVQVGGLSMCCVIIVTLNVEFGFSVCEWLNW